MRLSFILLAVIALGLIAALAVWWWLENTEAEPRDADAVFEAYFAEIGTEDKGEEEVPDRRFRMSYLYQRKAARFGRRPRP